MSEGTNTQSAILLPQSSVALFSKDHETLDSIRSVSDDWRFARVALNVEEGDIYTAIDAYADIQSPDLIIIQTEAIDDQLTIDLERLANNCDEGTAAIIIGPVNDVYLYRRLIDMGVSDYLVKPIETQAMAEVIARTLIEKIGVTGSRLISFIGTKGGVGASTIATASSWAVAEILQQKTLMLDISGGWSTLGLSMGFEPSTTLAEASRAASNGDEDNLNRTMHKVSENLSVLASGGEVMLEPCMDETQLENLIDFLMIKNPAVLVDVSHASPELAKTIIYRSNQVVVVSAPTLSSLRLARSLLHEIKEIRGDDNEGIEFVINQQGIDPANEVGKDDIEKAVEFKVSATLPFMPKLFLKHENEAKRFDTDKEGKRILDEMIVPILSKTFPSDVSQSSDAEGSSEKSGFFANLFKKG